MRSNLSYNSAEKSVTRYTSSLPIKVILLRNALRTPLTYSSKFDYQYILLVTDSNKKLQSYIVYFLLSPKNRLKK